MFFVCARGDGVGADFVNAGLDSRGVSLPGDCLVPLHATSGKLGVLMLRVKANKAGPANQGHVVWLLAPDAPP